MIFAIPAHIYHTDINKWHKYTRKNRSAMPDGACRLVAVLCGREMCFFYLIIVFSAHKKIKISRVGGKNRVGRVTPIKQFFLGLIITQPHNKNCKGLRNIPWRSSAQWNLVNAIFISQTVRCTEVSLKWKVDNMFLKWLDYVVKMIQL